ncbi:MAG: trypsin-like peptidase domain-containing protein [Patescibacteria group bacterium]|nr:trypsin-like peptidase domain-containing protein [Patescibacteria group bacterium]
MQNKKQLLQISVIAIGLVLIVLLFADLAIRMGWKGRIEKSLSFLTGATSTQTAVLPAVAPYESEDAHEAAVIKAVEEASPSVVSIIISKNIPVMGECQVNPFGDLPQEFQQYFGGNLNFTQPCPDSTGKTQKQEVGGGSGFVISKDGLILTNKHVVADEKADYTVMTSDGKKYDAKVLARDSVQDLAVLKIDANDLAPLRIGDSDSIKLGQTAIAIGNSLGEFRNTVSVGVISGLYRTITASDASSGSAENLDGLIQTDAAINPGNSGGPLLDLKGEVIGINTAIASNGQNIGFAIPINKAKNAIESVKKSGKIITPYLGVRYLTIDDQLAQKENLSVKQGALVRGSSDGPGVVKGSPADKAGLQAEDIITEVNGVAVDENHTLSSLIQNYQVGDRIALKILRNGKEVNVTVTLEERKN